jgi:hypothetical protein
MKKLYFLLLTLLLFRAETFAQATAQLMQSVTGRDPTPFYIKVKFAQPVPQADVVAVSFVIQDTDNSDKVVPVVGRSQEGVSVVTGGVTNWRSVKLYGQFDPSHAHKVTMTLPGQAPVELGVLAIREAPAASDEREPFITLHYTNLNVTLDPFVADDDSAFGLKYDVTYNLTKPVMLGSGQLRVNLRTHGEFSITSEEDSARSIQNSLKGGLEGKYLFVVPGDLLMPKSWDPANYFLGFRIAPAEFEANKSFDNVNYTFKALAGGAIPYLDLPAVWWNRTFNLTVPFFAPTLFTGFAGVSEVKDDGSDTLAKLGHARWDTEFIYALPLHQRVDFRFVWNWYVGIDEGFSRNNYEVGAVIYLDEKRTQGFTLSRQRGALPPDFIQTESWRFGYTAQF